jgi:hypothetical protein
LFLSGGLWWYASTVDERNAADSEALNAQVAEYDAMVREEAERIRAYADSAAELSRITFALRRAGERGPVLEANDRMIQSLQESRRLAEQSRESWRRVLDLTNGQGRMALSRRQRRREQLGHAAIASTVLLIGATLLVTWRWFGARASESRGVAA